MNRLIVGGVVTTAIVVAAGAGFAVGSLVGGGGTQPEDVLPDTMVVYADVDLDPSAQQKVNLVRLLGRFPDVERDYGDEPDWRTLVLDTLVEGSRLEEAGVQEWVGDRLGGGFLWDGTAATPVMALQVTDEQAALDDLRTVVDEEQLAVTDGYVVVTGDALSAVPVVDDLVESGPASATAEEVVAAGQEAPLAESDAFTAVFDRLDDGMVTLYADAERAAATAASAGADSLREWSGAGQAGAVLRAEPSALELLAWSTDAPRSTTGPATLVETLPASTVLAVEVTGLGDVVSERWDELVESAGEAGGARRLERELADIEAEYGLRLPEDLVTLVGSDLVVAVEGSGLLTGVPGVGLRSVTDPDAATDLARRLQRLLDPLTGGFGIVAEATDDGLLLASSSAYADTLVSGDGGLTSDEAFRLAVPDAGEATALLWVDLAAVSGFAQLAAPDQAGAISPLSGLGIAATPEEGGSRVRVRIVFTEGDDR